MHRQCRKIRKNTEKSLNNTGREVPAPRHCFASYERIRTRIVCDMAAYVAAIGQTSDFAWSSSVQEYTMKRWEGAQTHPSRKPVLGLFG